MRAHIYYQLDSVDCGPTCLRMIAKYYGKTYTLQYLRKNCFITREGVSMRGISEAAEKIGMKTLSAKITLDQLTNNILLPCILHWDHHHFVVCYNVKGKGEHRKFYINDPALGKVIYSQKEIYKHWISGTFDDEDIGLAMQVEPSVNFYKTEDEESNNVKDIAFFLNYILPHKKQIVQLLLGATVVMMLGYFTPFLSQSVVDLGIKNRDLDFIMLIMLVQLVIAFSQTLIQFIQNWLSLHMNTIININLISDYLLKLTRMPLHFFEIKTMGDILQRIGDNTRIKSFLMNDIVSIVFSIGTFLIFSIVLGIYNWQILLIFIIGNAFYVLWVLSFMRFRRELDNRTFVQSSKLQNNMVQFVQGMKEIKLNNIERQKLWEWEHLQAALYKISIRGMRLGQIQSAGSILFSNITSILISYLAARMVVTGDISLGMMVSLSFIIGQVSGPIGSFIGFARSYQDAKISLERLNEINKEEDEQTNVDSKLTEMPNDRDLYLNGVSYSYNGADHNYALNDISISIPHNKITAIVGASGCGKTTLIKLLQGFYIPQKGTITIGHTPLSMINPYVWRENIGSVMQDGYIFSDTIANNICLTNDNIDTKRLHEAAEKANLIEYISSLPLNYSTKIGDEGIGLSQGQKQRLLLARIIYKNPDLIFLDEATNSLDANNEKVILDNLKEFYLGKTVVVAAHRLSTVRDADNIIVLDQGRVVEQGKHNDLVQLKSYYYNLVHNQLEFAK